MRCAGIWRPEYFFRPGNMLRRLRYAAIAARPHVDVRLFGRPFRVRPADTIGEEVVLFGLYDLAVTEALWRLADPGEHAVDVGANIGCTVAVLLHRVGAGGRVTAFEAHPRVFDELAHNVARMRDGARVTAIHAAASDRSATVVLHVPASFARNRGVASLEAFRQGHDAVEVRCVTLDEALVSGARIGVMKIDVEKHEPAVLRGAAGLLARKGVRDIVFEEHQPAQSAAAAYLVEAGYAVFRLRKRFHRIDLIAPDCPVHASREAPSLLATLDPERARARFARWGWRSLAAIGGISKVR